MDDACFKTNNSAIKIAHVVNHKELSPMTHFRALPIDLTKHMTAS